MHSTHFTWSGILYTEWKLGKLREGSGKFPIEFCDTCWIEDEPVADRALEVWPSIVATVKHEGLWKSAWPQNNRSYQTLVGNHLDLLVQAKLHFFAFLANIISQYLIMSQTNAPMLLVWWALLYYIQAIAPSVQTEKNWHKEKPKRVNKLRILEKWWQKKMDEMQVDIGAAMKNSLNKNCLSLETKRKFRKECAILCILLKLLERLFTNKMIVVQAASLSRQNMNRNPTKLAEDSNHWLITCLLWKKSHQKLLIMSRISSENF